MNSADGRLFDPARHPRRPFMDDGELRLIHHSNLQRIYGLDVADRRRSSRIRPELRWRLDVYGDGPWRPQIEAAIARTGTADRVHLHGRVPMDELPALLAGRRHRARAVAARSRTCSTRSPPSCSSTRPWGCRSSPATSPPSAPTSPAMRSATCPAAIPTRWRTGSEPSPPTRSRPPRPGRRGASPGGAVRVGAPGEALRGDRRRAAAAR